MASAQLSTLTPSCLTAPGGLIANLIRSREDLTITAVGDISATAQGNVTIIGDENLNLEADGNISIAAIGNISSTAQGNISSTAQGNMSSTAIGDISITAGPTGDPNIALTQTNPNPQGSTGTTITQTADNINLAVTNSIRCAGPVYAPAFITKTGTVTIPEGGGDVDIGVTFTNVDTGVWIFSVSVPQTASAFVYLSLWTVLDAGTGAISPADVAPLDTTNQPFEFAQEELTGQVVTSLAFEPPAEYEAVYNPLFVPATAVEVLTGFPFDVDDKGVRDYWLKPKVDENAKYLNPIIMTVNEDNVGTTLKWSLTKLSAF
jgi:hypothetical protein